MAALFDTVVKDALTKLGAEGCILSEEDFAVGGDVVPSALGRASSEYYLQYKTPKQILLGLVECGKLVKVIIDDRKERDTGTAINVRDLPFSNSSKNSEAAVAWLLYTIACTHEFDELPVRHNEEILNEELSDGLMWGPEARPFPPSNGGPSYINPELYEDPHTK